MELYPPLDKLVKYAPRNPQERQQISCTDIQASTHPSAMPLPFLW